jgi:hypothetical protein
MRSLSRGRWHYNLAGLWPTGLSYEIPEGSIIVSGGRKGDLERMGIRVLKSYNNYGIWSFAIPNTVRNRQLLRLI